MAAYINNIIDAAHYPEITVIVPPCPVSSKVNSVNLRPILLPVAFIVAPDCPQHRRPGPLDNQIAALIGADSFAVAGHDVGFDSGKRFCGRTGLRRSRTGDRSNHDGAGFSLPPRIDNRTAFLADYLPIPHPRLRVDRFTDRAE